MKLFKKTFILTILVLFALSITSCKKDEEDPDKKDPEDKIVDVALAETFNNVAKDTKIYLTTVGQSDVPYAEQILKTAGVAEDGYTKTELLNASEVDKSGTKKPVVFVVTGTSNKGLTSSGSSAAKEKTRAIEFANAAEAGDIVLVVLHLGGKARRGESTDPILAEIVPHANLVLVVSGDDAADGNYDGLFTDYQKNDNVPTYYYSTKAKVTMAIKTLAGLE